MPLELGVWRVDGQGTKAKPIELAQLDLESRLESILADDIRIANSDWMVIGRQVRTPFGGTSVDLLALDSEGELVVLELKRDKTPRDILAQVLEYGAWVVGLKTDDIARIFADYQKRYSPGTQARSLDQAFCERFRVREMPEELNESHQLVIVASALDVTTERVVTYLLNHHHVSINAVFFRVFRDEGREYLSRVWLHDPFAAEAEPSVPEVESTWNGEVYVSFGGGRNWADAAKYGYISAGGGRWYSDSLKSLKPNERVWVRVPGTGYVGVGVVEEAAVPCEQFKVRDGNDQFVPLMNVSPEAKSWSTAKDDPDGAEYLVRVRWLKTVPESEPISEKGLFGNQNTVARPTSEKWNHTIERLKTRFGVS